MADATSNVSGVVMRILVKEGDKVEMDQDILAVESMKMEMLIPANAKGTVQKIHVAVEDFVQEGQVLLTVS